MKIRNKQTGQIIEVTEDQLADYGLSPMAKGGMIKRADGSYSRRGLWDNIRANKGSGRKPTKEMLKQEKKIRAAEKAYGGYMQMGGGLTDWFMATGGGINNPGFRALPDYVQEKIIDNMASGGCMECGGKMQVGGIRSDYNILPSDNTRLPINYIDVSKTMIPIKLTPEEEKIANTLYKSNADLGENKEFYRREVKKRGLTNKSKMSPMDIFSFEPTYSEGGKLPKEILRARLESHMSPGEAQDYLSSYGMGGYLDEAAEGKWIQKATASIKRRGTEGVCTGSKFGSSSCPPGSRRYNLAKTFRKMAKSRKKEDGGYAVGSEHEMTDAQIANLRAMGYKIKEV